MQQEVERIATDFGMPTRSELDSIGQRLHDLRREMRNGGRVEASGDLAREVDRLRREVAALKAAVNAKATRSHEAVAPKAAVAPAKTPRHQRARPPKKRTQQVAALRADVKESVSTGPVAPKVPAPKKKPVVRAKPRSQARASRRVAPPRAKKSVAKIAHIPTRIGHPVASFAQRMAAFAKTAHKHTAARRNGGR
jgi:hypothetical protein